MKNSTAKNMTRNYRSSNRSEISKLYRKLNNLIDCLIANADEEELANLLIKLDELYVRVNDGIDDIHDRTQYSSDFKARRFEVLSQDEINMLLSA